MLKAALLTFHDLLDFHLECDNLPNSRLIGVIEVTFESVNGKITVLDSSDIVVLQEDHLVGVLNYGTEINKEKYKFTSGLSVKEKHNSTSMK